MNLMDRGLELLTVAIIGLIPLFVSSAAHAASLVTDVQNAWRSEVLARRHYLVFARRAEEEGFGEIASLFRAISQAEAVHAARHLRIIERLGGSATEPDDRPSYGPTFENLEFAAKQEFQERGRNYAALLNEHDEAEDQEVVRSFALARAAEAKNERLCTEALQRFDDLRGSARKTFYVCPVCGYITEARTFTLCPGCSTKVLQFRMVS